MRLDAWSMLMTRISLHLPEHDNGKVHCGTPRLLQLALGGTPAVILLVLQKMRAIKRSKTRDKREQAHREALRAVQQTDTKEAPRSVAGRIPGAFAGESIAKFQQVTLCRTLLHLQAGHCW